PGDAERHTPGEALELVRQERGVGGNDADDRALLLARAALDHRRLAQFGADPPTADRQVAALAEIGLDEAADRIALSLPFDQPGGGAGAPLEAVADHAGAAADAALFDRSGRRAVEGGGGVPG